MSNGINLRVVPQPPIIEIGIKFIDNIFVSNIPGANVLK